MVGDREEEPPRDEEEPLRLVPEETPEAAPETREAPETGEAPDPGVPAGAKPRVARTGPEPGGTPEPPPEPAPPTLVPLAAGRILAWPFAGTRGITYGLSLVPWLLLLVAPRLLGRLPVPTVFLTPAWLLVALLLWLAWVPDVVRAARDADRELPPWPDFLTQAEVFGTGAKGLLVLLPWFAPALVAACLDAEPAVVTALVTAGVLPAPAALLCLAGSGSVLRSGPLRALRVMWAGGGRYLLCLAPLVAAVLGRALSSGVLLHVLLELAVLHALALSSLMGGLLLRESEAVEDLVTAD